MVVVEERERSERDLAEIVALFGRVWQRWRWREIRCEIRSQIRLEIR